MILGVDMAEEAVVIRIRADSEREGGDDSGDV
jgi:hypothetical protein